MQNLELGAIFEGILKSNAFFKSTELKEYAKSLGDTATQRTGTIEVTRVAGTSIQTFLAYVKVTPTWRNEVFKGKLEVLVEGRYFVPLEINAKFKTPFSVALKAVCRGMAKPR